MPNRSHCTCPADHRGIIIGRIRIERSGCWMWKGARTPDGYARLSHRRTSWTAHRFAYETFVGPIPAGLVLDHLCRNRACVQPGHLDPVTDRVNILRGVGGAARNARKQYCPLGHELPPVLPIEAGPQIRRCKSCKRADQRKNRAPLQPDDPRHGTVNGYNNWKCRCDRCRLAWTTDHTAYMHRRRAQFAGGEI